MRYFTALVEALFGTPRRWMVTLTIIGLGVVALNPGLLATVTSRLVAELSPLLGPALAIVIVFGGLRMILFGKK